jgi:hypothetical protein
MKAPPTREPIPLAPAADHSWRSPSSTPKALRPPAQGCEERATLGLFHDSASSIGAGIYGGNNVPQKRRTLFFIAALFALFLPACASKPQRHTWDLARSPDNTLAIAMGNSRFYRQYRLHSTQKPGLLGTGRSHFFDNFIISHSKLRSHFKVNFSPDNRAIAITEDLSNSSSVKRYILFTRTDRANYTTTYLHPPAVKVPPPTGISKVYPRIRSLTATTITFQDVNNRVYTVPIAKIPVFAFPQNAQ